MINIEINISYILLYIDIIVVITIDDRIYKSLYISNSLINIFIMLKYEDVITEKRIHDKNILYGYNTCGKWYPISPAIDKNELYIIIDIAKEIISIFI